MLLFDQFVRLLVLFLNLIYLIILLLLIVIY